jgi:hypothetical protein
MYSSFVCVAWHNNRFFSLCLRIAFPSLLPLPSLLPPQDTVCYNHWTGSVCGGHEGRNCSCFAKLSPLPKYRQLRVAVTSFVPLAADTDMDGALTTGHRRSDPAYRTINTTSHGHSTLFVLTDVATVPLLLELYSIPTGLTVRHGSNQSVIEFYNEFYSNSDLQAFMALTGETTTRSLNHHHRNHTFTNPHPLSTHPSS